MKICLIERVHVAIDNWPQSLEHCIAPNGDHFEQTIYMPMTGTLCYGTGFHAKTNS